MPTGSFPAIFLFAFLISLGAVVSPGPVSAAIISEAPRRGWAVGPLVASGHALMELLFTLLIALGLSAGLARPGLQRLIAAGGGLLLLYIGGTYLSSLARGRIALPQADPALPGKSLGALLALGVATTLANPFWYAWWATVVPGYLAEAQAMGTASIAAFYLGHISADFTWDTLLSTAASKGRRLLSDRGYRVLIGAMAAFMIYLGLVFLRLGLNLGA
jgi:threonine/homoserine/homoserine lactone efflux protein